MLADKYKKLRVPKLSDPLLKHNSIPVHISLYPFHMTLQELSLKESMQGLIAVSN